MAEITLDYTLPDNSPDGDVEIYRSTSLGALGTLVTTRSPSDATEFVDTGLAQETKFYYTVRRKTDHATVDSTQVAQWSKPPATTDLQVTTDEDAATHSLSWTDNASAEDGFDVLETRDGGVQATAAAGLSPDTTAYTTDRQDRTSTYEYQIRVFVGSGSERASSVSNTVTASFPAYPNYWAEVRESDGTTHILTRTLGSGPDYEYNAVHGYGLEIPISDADLAGWNRGTMLDAFLDGERLFHGKMAEVVEESVGDGRALIDARGPLKELETTAPASPVEYTNVRVDQAIQDYIDTYVSQDHDVDATVVDPPGDVQTDDTRVLSDDFTGFSGLASPASDVPINVDGASLTLEPAAYIGVEDDFGGPYTTGDDFSDGTAPWHIDSAYANLTTGSVYVDITPSHDIPSERVGVAIHGDALDTAVGDITQYPLTLGGVEVDTLPFLDDGGRWGLYPDGYGSAGGGDLTAGNTYRLELALNGSEAEYNIDALVLYDTEYGPYTFDNPTSLGEKIDGPQPYKPVTADLVDESRTYAIQIARVESTANDVSGAFAWEFSTTGGSSSITKANTQNATFDFFANAQYGTTLEPTVTLDGYGSNSWLSDGASGQEITSLDIYLTTVDIAVLSSIELSGSHRENYLRLVEAAGMHSVVDPTVDTTVDPITIEVFRPDSPSVLKQPTWTRIDYSRRHVFGDYFNAVTVNYRDANDVDQQFALVADSEEVSRVGDEYRKTELATNVETNDQARNYAVNRRRELIRNDVLGGTIEARVEPILPGYPYDIDIFGDEPTIVRRTSYLETVDSRTMSLKCEPDDDVEVGQQVETKREIQTLKETQ